MIADRRLWLTADRTRVVEDGDPRAAFQLASPGHLIPDQEAQRLGLLPTDKGRLAPADKAVRQAANKGA